MSGEQPQRRQRQGEEDEGSGEPQPTPGATPSSRQPGSALSRATEGRETTLDDLYLLERKNHPLYALYRRQTRRPYRKGYAAALLRRINEALDRELYRSSAVQRARDRAQIALMRLFDFMTPNKLNHHVSWAIGLYLLILSVTFMAMAGGFQLQRAGGPDADAFPDWGPAELKRYVQGKDAYKFDEPYLVEWGAVTSEKAGSADQFWRWLTSPLLYNSFPRFAADVLLMLLLGGLLEYKYGGGWLAFFLVVCALGSTFFAAALAPSCDITFSSSGVVPALLLLYSLDVGFGWTVPHLGLLHAAFVFTLLLLWVALRTAFGWPPARTVAGGLLVGAVVGPAMLPSLRWQKLEEAASATLLAGVLGIFSVALPVAQSVLTSAGSCS